MKGIVSQIHLPQKVVRPFLMSSDASREYSLFSESSQLIILLCEKDNIMSSISSGFGCTVWHKGHLKTDDSWNFIRQLDIPRSILVMLASQTDEILLTGFRAKVKFLSHRQNVVKTDESLDQEDWLMVVDDFGAESKPDIGGDSVNKGELATVVSIDIGQLD